MKTTKNKVLVSLILDKSGSMSIMQNQTISGVNEYVNSLKKDKKVDYDFALTTFNHDVVIGEAVPIKEFKELTTTSYSPDGMTALYDAVCITCKKIAKETKKTQKVLVAIMTDGAENSSKEYDMKSLNKMITELTDTGRFTFVFLGANQDSFEMARSMNISTSNVSNYTTSSAGMKTVFSTLASTTSNYGGASASQTSSFFSKSDQELMNNTK